VLLEVEHLGLRAQPEPYQELGRQQRNVMAGSTIDLDEIAMPEILDPRQIQGAAFRFPFPECSTDAR
jgi:hypothetical protein